MKAWTRGAMCVVAVLALATGAWAQFMTAPGVEGTLTVTVSGVAAAAPDWVDVNLPISTSGASAEAALMAAQDSRERTVSALVKAGIKPGQIKTTATQIAASSPQPWEQPQAGGPTIKFGASSTVRVRITPAADTLYSDICQVLDTAATAGAPSAPGAGGVNVMAMMRGGTQNSVIFGVNDRSALTAKAVGNALEEAKKVAEQAATLAGKTLGDLLALQVLPPSASGPLAMMDMLGTMTQDPESNGKAVATATVSATYRLK